MLKYYFHKIMKVKGVSFWEGVRKTIAVLLLADRKFFIYILLIWYFYKSYAGWSLWHP